MEKFRAQFQASFEKRLAFYFFTFALWVAWVAWTTGVRDGFPTWVNQWHRWDAEWYWRIWNDGYTFDPTTLAFPPGYSWLVGYLNRFTGLAFDLVAMLVGLISYFFAGVTIVEFTFRRWRTSRAAMWFGHLACPVGYFAFAPYSDAFFLLIFWSLLPLAVRPFAELSRLEKLLAWLLSLLAPVVRLPAFAIAVWILFKRWYALAVIPPLLFLLFVSWSATGNALYFLGAQQSFLMPSGWFFSGLKYHVLELFNPPRWWEWQNAYFWLQITLLPLLSLGVFLMVVVWLLRRREFLLATTVFVMLVFSRNQAYWRSVFRYDMQLMPLIGVSILSFGTDRVGVWKWLSRGVFVILLLMGFALQWLFAERMHNGAWTF